MQSSHQSYSRKYAGANGANWGTLLLCQPRPQNDARANDGPGRAGPPDHIEFDFARLPLLGQPAVDEPRSWPVEYRRDPYEQEADRAAQEAIEALPAPGLPHAGEDAPGPGRTLPDRLRQGLEQAFARDLRRVRIHPNAPASSQVSGRGARALTLGPDIAFAPGQYAPGKTSGMKLLAHEIAHVAQQGHAPLLPGRAGQAPLSISQRPAASQAAQPTIEVDPTKFSGGNAGQLGMTLPQFKSHIESELSAVTGLSVNFNGNRLTMRGSTASSATAVRVLRMAHDALPPPYFIDPIPGDSGHPIQDSSRRGIELGTGPFPAVSLRAMRRGIIIIHEFAHVFSTQLAGPQHNQRLRDLWTRYRRAERPDGRLRESFTTEELNMIHQSGGPPTGSGPVSIPVSQEIIPVDIANRVRGELGLGIRRVTYITPIQIGRQIVEFAQFLVEGARPPMYIYQNARTGELFCSEIDFMQEGGRVGRPARPGGSQLRPINQCPALNRYLDTRPAAGQTAAP